MLRVLRRRGLVVLLATVVTAGAAYAVAALRTDSYSTEGIAVIAANRALSPDQAVGLAVTDAVLIPRDDAIAESVARALQTTPKDVRHRLSVFNDPATAILRISYRGATASEAQAGATAVLRSIAGPRPVSSNIAAGSIQIVRLPTLPAASRGTPTLVAIGVILGLALGAILLVAWERADPRVDDLDDLGAVVATPAVSFDTLSDAAAAALLGRWRKLGAGPPVSVALVPATENLEPTLGDLAYALARGNDTTMVAAPLASRQVRPIRFETSLVPAGVPGGPLAGEGVASACNVTVLVVKSGTRRADLRRALEALHRFGVEPAWTIFLSPCALEALPQSYPDEDRPEPDRAYPLRSALDS
jgi:capsular polysaccharide biosynthesis protein